MSSTPATSPTSTTRSTPAPRANIPDLPLNAAIAEVTSRTLAQYRADVAALGCLPPTEEPRATDHMPEMRALIERLVRRGVAYVAEDHALFSPVAMDALPGAPRYGALARRSLDEMLAGARVDVAPYKRDPMDFVLWKPSKPGEPAWELPAGIAVPGRPGWHIECSAMAMKTLLTPFGGGLACEDADSQVFDIHGGGVDLVFPHHENEIAQSCCAFGTTRMANVWMHNGFLQVEAEKMSKSLGNFITINDLLRTDAFGGRAWPGAGGCGSPCCAAIIASRSTGRCARWRRRRRRWCVSLGSPRAPRRRRRATRSSRRSPMISTRRRRWRIFTPSPTKARRRSYGATGMLGLDIEAAIAAEARRRRSTRRCAPASRRWSRSGSPPARRKTGPPPTVCATNWRRWASR